MPAHEGCHGIDRRRPAFDGNAVARLDAWHERQRLVVQRAGVQRRDRDRQAMARDQVGEHHVLGAEARRENDARRVCGGRLPQAAQCLSDARFVALRVAAVARDGARGGGIGSGSESNGGEISRGENSGR